MITKVVLKNFKRFKDETFELDKVTVLAGVNNSGKSTVIQAIATWHFALGKWLESGRTTQRTGVSRKEFSSVPLIEFNQLWTDKSTKNPNGKSPRRLIIEVHGEGGGLTNLRWELGMEFIYTNKDQVYVKPTVSRAEIPDEAKN